jgi:hypothetical protein
MKIAASQQMDAGYSMVDGRSTEFPSSKRGAQHA